MRFIQTVLRGIGQVMFQNNIYSGILFLGGIFYNSWLLGLAAVLGTIISTAAAQILKYPKQDIQNGLYGFNGALTGIAVFCFFEVNAMTFSALVLGAFLSTPLSHFLKKLISPFTAPFVLVTWFLIYSLLFLFQIPLLSATAPTETHLQIASALGNSFGQVMFQKNVITGILFVLAIFINNKLMAVYALFAAILGSLSGCVFGESVDHINSGLMGYNAILCAIALCGKKRSDFLWITGAIILSTFLNIVLAKTGIITLTAPFVLATWIILTLQNLQINGAKTVA